MVHASVLVHWVTKIPKRFVYQEKVLEIAVAFFRTNNPLRFHEYMGTLRKDSDWKANLYLGFLQYSVSKWGSISGGETIRYQCTCNGPIMQATLYISLKRLLDAVTNANTVSPNNTTPVPRTSYERLLSAVKLAEGFGTLLGPKFILSMTFVGLINAVGYADYMNAGSGKQRSRLKELFGLQKASHLPQLIRYIGTEAGVGEDVAEEIICAGCRELTGNLERYKDVVLGGGASLYFFQKASTGKPVRRLLSPRGLLEGEFIPQVIPVERKVWSVHGVDEYKINAENLVYFPSLANHQDKIENERKTEEKYDWPPMVNYESLKTWITKGLYRVLHAPYQSKWSLKFSWCCQTMKRRSVMVVVQSDNADCFEGHIVAVLFKHNRQEKIHAVYLSKKLVSSKLLAIVPSKLRKTTRVRIRLCSTKK